MVERTDTKPWYKQFWPWFVMSLPASAVVAGIITLFIANEHADSLVVDDYYKQGLAINVKSAKLSKAAELGIEADLSIHTDNLVALKLNLALPEGQGLTLKFIHPGEAKRDFTLALEKQADGAYAARAPFPISGRWYLQLTDEDSWMLKAELPIGTRDLKLLPEASS